MSDEATPFRFSKGDVERLVAVVGDDPPLLAALEADAQVYLEDVEWFAEEDPEDWPVNSKVLRNHIEKIRGAVERLFSTINAAPERVRDIVAGWALGQGHNWDKTSRALHEITFQANRWLDNPNPPGPKYDQARRNLCLNVARTLDEHGITPTKYTHDDNRPEELVGQLARVFRIVYESASGKRLAKSPKRDVSWAVNVLKAESGVVGTRREQNRSE